MFFWQVVAAVRQSSYQRRRDAEDLDLMLCAKLPHAVGGWIIRGAVVDADGRAIYESSVDQPWTHHPADVRVPANPRAATDIRSERHVLSRLDRKTRMRVRDTLRLTRRAGGVEDNERVFGGGF